MAVVTGSAGQVMDVLPAMPTKEAIMTIIRQQQERLRGPTAGVAQGWHRATQARHGVPDRQAEQR